MFTLYGYLSQFSSPRETILKKLLMFIVIILVLMPVFLLLRTTLISHFAFVPTPLDVVPKADTFDAEELFLAVSASEKIHTLYFQAQAPASLKGRVVLYLHGNGGNLYSRIKTVNELRQQGINVLLIDYRGYGLSDGKASEQNLYEDVTAAFLYLEGVKGFNAKDIIVLGRSIGSTGAMYLAENFQPSAVVLISPIASAAAMADVMGMSWISFMAQGALDNVARAKIVKVPVLIIHGDADVMVPINQGRKIYAALVHSAAKEFIVVPEAKHADVRTIAGESFWLSIMTFIASHIQD